MTAVDPIPEHILRYLVSLQLSGEAFAYVRASFLGPSRRPNGYRSNTVRYPSLLTQKIITSESRSIEFGLKLSLHADPNVVSILEQPHELQATPPRKGSDGKYRPDFLVIWRDRPPTIYEGKHVARLAKLVAEKPLLYKEIGPGKFTLPAAEAAAAKLGFTFRVITEFNLDPIFLGNARFLEPYRRWRLETPPTDSEVGAIRSQIDANQGLMLDQVVCECASRRADLTRPDGHALPLQVGEG